VSLVVCTFIRHIPYVHNVLMLLVRSVMLKQQAESCAFFGIVLTYSGLNQQSADWCRTGST